MVNYKARDTTHVGARWITGLQVARGDRCRMCHHMESQVYLPDDDGGEAR